FGDRAGWDNAGTRPGGSAGRRSAGMPPKHHRGWTALAMARMQRKTMIKPSLRKMLMTSRMLAAVALAVSLQGCAAAGLALVGAGAGVGMGTGVEHELKWGRLQDVRDAGRSCAPCDTRHFDAARYADHGRYANQ